ncbi:hypothetical protein B0H34DRAFT_675884 [Crassisporium funariophilum]|nr:hypothetical protein B0H34DRAFT_675884 [Crassisporium funariophilum]
MRFFIATFLCFLFSVVLEAQADCPPSNDAIQKMAVPLQAKFEEVCKLGIKPGGDADLNWVYQNVISYYLSKAFIGKELPKGLVKDTDAILKKCYKPTYNFCIESDRAKLASCVKDLVGSLVVRPTQIRLASSGVLSGVGQDRGRLAEQASGKSDEVHDGLLSNKGKDMLRREAGAHIIGAMIVDNQAEDIAWMIKGVPGSRCFGGHSDIMTSFYSIHDVQCRLEVDHDSVGKCNKGKVGQARDSTLKFPKDGKVSALTVICLEVDDHQGETRKENLRSGQGVFTTN